MFGSIAFGKMAGRKVGKIFGIDGKDLLEKEVSDQGLSKEGMDIDVDDDGNVSVSGEAASQADKEKVLLAIGNIFGVGSIEDNASAKDGGRESQFHTVVSGDTLWKISKKYYGKGSRYPEIFEANRPMLSHPDKIYVGQVLRIPVDAPDDNKVA